MLKLTTEVFVERCEKILVIRSEGYLSSIPEVHCKSLRGWIGLCIFMLASWFPGIRFQELWWSLKESFGSSKWEWMWWISSWLSLKDWGVVIVAEIYIEMCWDLLVKVIPLVEKLARVWYCGLEEFPCINVDFVFGWTSLWGCQFKRNVLMCYPMIWDLMV